VKVTQKRVRFLWGHGFVPFFAFSTGCFAGGGAVKTAICCFSSAAIFAIANRLLGCVKAVLKIGVCSATERKKDFEKLN
jgi:hypothetical protein